jgi:ABC-type Fe3+ transport system substrate-binding protein
VEAMGYTKMQLIKFITIVTVCACLQCSAKALAAAENKSTAEPEWETIVKKAKAEGQLNIYSGAIPASIITEGTFQKRFPEIKIVTVIGQGGAGAVNRILAERRAEKYVADLILGTSSSIWTLYSIKALDPIAPVLVLPENRDQSKWWGGTSHYVDSEKQFIFTFMGSPRGGSVFYNTNLVNPNDIKSYWDFVEPKWKGKIEARDLRGRDSAPPSVRFLYYHSALGSKYLKRLFGEMDVTLFRDRRVSVDWLATGKFSLCFLCLPSEIAKATRQKLPVETFGVLKEGAFLDSLTGNIGLLKQAPNRNAAIVFLNWLLSREGQLTAQRVQAKADVGVSNSLRTDISKDMVPADERPVSGTNYLELDTAEKIPSEPIIKIFKEAAAKPEKK